MKILATSKDIRESDLEAIRALGHEADYQMDEHVIVAHPEQYDALICNSLLYHQDYRPFVNVKYVQILSIGLNRVPLDWIKERGITLYNAHGVYSAPMAEWTIMRILELYRHVPQGIRSQLSASWQRDIRLQELTGKKALIVGFGGYGTELAKRLKPFGVTISVVNRTQKNDPNVDHFYPLGQLKEELPKADIVVLAIAHTPDTEHLIDQEELALMKDGSVLLNAARGALIDESALLAALDSGKLLGAALDVFGQEPLPADSPLWKNEKLLLSPHTSFAGDLNHERLMALILKNLKEYKE